MFGRQWVLNVAHDRADRLIVFVHGFRGKATTTWQDFPSVDADDDWWGHSDLLFVGYNSMKDGITGVAHRLEQQLPQFYPFPYPPAMNLDGVTPREDTKSPYAELILVGHSLGGLIVRRAMIDAADRFLDTGQPELLLEAQLRLFSPAIAGFRPGGALGSIHALKQWGALEIYLRRASAYTDLQPDSIAIAFVKQRTEELAIDPRLHALRAQILWASPDNVVDPTRYSVDTDYSADGQDHGSVCKPREPDYPKPRYFVRHGRPE